MTKMPHIGGQVLIEFDEFITFVNEFKPRSYLEIGACRGIALRYLVERVPSIKRITVVDLPEAAWGGHDSLKRLRENLAALSHRRIVHIGDSADPEIVRAVAQRRYDLVFIDADHTYEAVARDYRNYAPLANKLVAFHDVAHPPISTAYGATKFWNEIKVGSRYHEIIHGKCGIGVLIL